MVQAPALPFLPPCPSLPQRPQDPTGGRQWTGRPPHSAFPSTPEPLGMPPTARPGDCGTALRGGQMVEGSLGDHTKEKMDRLLLPAPMGPGVGPEVIGAQRQPNQRHWCAWSSMVMHVGPWGGPRSQTLEHPLGQAQQRGGQPQFPIAPLCGRGRVGSYLQICPASPGRPHRCPKEESAAGPGCVL